MAYLQQEPFPMRAYRMLSLSAATLASALWLTACASHEPPGAASSLAAVPDAPLSAAQRLQWLDRVTWGASDSADQHLERLGLHRWLNEQLAPQQPALPGDAHTGADHAHSRQSALAQALQTTPVWRQPGRQIHPLSLALWRRAVQV